MSDIIIFIYLFFFFSSVLIDNLYYLKPLFPWIYRWG